MMILGNTSMWIVAAAFGAPYGWPSVFVLLKPTLLPFALLGAKKRGWWLGLAVLLVASLPFGLLWIDWVWATMMDPKTAGSCTQLVTGR